MSPTIVENSQGEFVLAVASAGGSRIISAVAQTVRNFIDFGMGALQALASPRLHDQVYPPMLFLEQDTPAIGFSGCVFSLAATGAPRWSTPTDARPAAVPRPRRFTNESFTYLASLGHNATYVPTGLSVACAVARTAGGGWDAAGDPRKFDTGGSTFPARRTEP